MEGPPNKKRSNGVGDGSLQSHSGENLNPKRARNRGNVPKGGEADGVALTAISTSTSETTCSQIVCRRDPVSSASMSSLAWS
jgi:hypothetical protein